MRVAILTFILIVSWSGATTRQPNQIKDADFSNGELEEQDTRTLQIDGVDCECCACFIAVKVKKLPGVKSAFDLPSIGMVVIRYYESQVDAATLIQAIEELGFDLKVDSPDSTNLGTKQWRSKPGEI